MMKPRPPHADFPIPQHRLACMQHLATLVGAGYHYWHSGTVHYEKVFGFVHKMHSLYPIDRTPGQRAVAREKGIANVELVLFVDQSKPGYILWYLLATRGKKAIDPLTGKVDESKGFTDTIFTMEKMKDARAIPLTWLGHYRLMQHQKALDPKKRRSRKLVWTWLHSKQTFHEWACRVEQAAKAGNGILLREFKPLLMAPMFSGVREDVTKLGHLAAVAYRKNHRGEQYRSPLPPMLPYVTKVEVFSGATLLALVEELRQQDLEAKADAAEATKPLLAGVEPPNKYTQSLTEKVNGNFEKEV